MRLNIAPNLKSEIIEKTLLKTFSYQLKIISTKRFINTDLKIKLINTMVIPKILYIQQILYLPTLTEKLTFPQ